MKIKKGKVSSKRSELDKDYIVTIVKRYSIILIVQIEPNIDVINLFIYILDFEDNF